MDGLHVAFQGFVGGIPELRYTPGGKATLAFSVAATDTKAMAKGEAPTWIRCTCWEQRAEELQDTIKKGVEVYVEGKLTVSHWTDKASGENRAGLNCSCWTVQLLGAIGKKAPQRPTPAAIGRPVMPARADTREPVAAAAAGRPEPWPGAAG